MVGVHFANIKLLALMFAFFVGAFSLLPFVLSEFLCRSEGSQIQMLAISFAAE